MTESHFSKPKDNMIDIVSNLTSSSNITFHTDANGNLECPQFSESDEDVVEKTAFYIEGKGNPFMDEVLVVLYVSSNIIYIQRFKLWPVISFHF